MMLQLFFLSILFSLCIGDCYLHTPRGSNNRLNEKSANRNNGNRLFDSQNNNRGGYNVGDMHRTDGHNTYGPANRIDRDRLLYDVREKNHWANAGSDQKMQYEAINYDGSEVTISWTAQHGCGNNKNNCNMVVDWACDTVDYTKGWDEMTDVDIDGMRMQLLNGLNTGTPNDANGLQNVQNTYNNNNNNDRGRHESEEYYAIGKLRERNKGLFTADQKLHGNKQINTRQNPGGTRRGLEIPEERDYYPWWMPSPWKTLAIFHDDVEECKEKMLKHDQSNEQKCHCIPTAKGTDGLVEASNEIVSYVTQAACEANNGEWKCYKWDFSSLPEEQQPKCILNKWSQVNNLGNVDGTPDGGLPQTQNFTLPPLSVMGMEANHCYLYPWVPEDPNNPNNNQQYKGAGEGKKYARIVMRIRYNMTTGDYDPYLTDASCNQNNKLRRQSPIQQNPTVDIGVEMQGLRLAINTAQTGRTFQDRSHVFRISNVPNVLSGKTVKNLIVQGKRGNIVQTFPAVEYDFYPKTLKIKAGECINFQWEGSNTHNNGNPAGDGQAGDAGEGRGGSDRHNLVQMLNEDQSYPFPWDQSQFNDIEFFHTTQCYFLDGTAVSTALYSGDTPEANKRDAQLYLATGSFYNGMTDIAASQQNNPAGAKEFDSLLNNAPASMRPITCCTTAASKGSYVFTNTRNNNFSNRDQKLKIQVD